jgi:choline dehydrogenase-like flavoprotein
MKVFGTDNLYVCSNAAFPTCAAVNPTLTLTAMTLRLGDHLNGNATQQARQEMFA